MDSLINSPYRLSYQTYKDREYFEETVLRLEQNKQTHKILNDIKLMPPPKFRVSGTKSALVRRNFILRMQKPKPFKPDKYQLIFKKLINKGVNFDDAKKIIKKIKKDRIRNKKIGQLFNFKNKK